jgi:hypothetical protein
MKTLEIRSCSTLVPKLRLRNEWEGLSYKVDQTAQIRETSAKDLKI